MNRTYHYERISLFLQQENKTAIVKYRKSLTGRLIIPVVYDFICVGYTYRLDEMAVKKISDVYWRIIIDIL